MVNSELAASDVPTRSVAIAHDYLTQCGGAERVVLDIAAGFPGSPIYTSLYDRARTFPDFQQLQVVASSLNHWAPLRAHHRLALPLLAGTVSRMTIDADAVIASSSGWAHGMHTTGKKIVYCHAPARWLYQSTNYLGELPGGLAARARHTATAASLAGMSGRLRKWDRAQAASADLYLANSTITKAWVKKVYDIDAEVVPPPPGLLPAGESRAIDELEPGYFLCVARLLPYKNVDAVINAVGQLPAERLVVVGAGPDRVRLETIAARYGDRITFAGRVADDQLRWLYSSAKSLVTASIEDYGLTPLEAAAFGKPTVALRAGGFLDTIDEWITGVFFDDLDPATLAYALEQSNAQTWDPAALANHATKFSSASFHARLHKIVSRVLDPTHPSLL